MSMTKRAALALLLAVVWISSALAAFPSMSFDDGGITIQMQDGSKLRFPGNLLNGVSAAPVNTSLPTVTGTAQVNATLTGTTGTFSNTPTSYAEQWYRGVTAISNATNLTYSPVSADVGSPLTLHVTASNASGPSVVAISAPTAAVIAAPTVAVPAVSTLPVISGTLVAQNVLTTTNGVWTNTPTSYAYQWNTAGLADAGATLSSYTTVNADIGKTITVTVTATNAGGSTSATSAATAAIGAPASSNTGSVLSYAEPSSSQDIPNINAGVVIDASEPTSVATFNEGTPGIQLDSSGNVLGGNDASGVVPFQHGYGQTSYKATGGPANAAYFHDDGTLNGGYDAIQIFDPAGLVSPVGKQIANSAFAANNAPWYGVCVARELQGTSFADLFKAHAASGSPFIDIQLAQAGDGSITADDNQDHAYGNETVSSLTGLNQWQIVEFFNDGSMLHVDRNGHNTLITPAGATSGFGTGNIGQIEFLNGPFGDVTKCEFVPGVPSQTQRNTILANRASRYSLASPVTVTDGPTSPIAALAPPTAAQTFTNYIVNSPFPSAVDPTDNTAKPAGWPSGDQANLTNKLSLVFGSANASTLSPNCSACVITNRAQLDSHVEHNQIDGTAGLNIDGTVKDVNPGAFNAAFRSFPAGDIHDTTVVDTDALTFHAYCVGNGGTLCQGQNNIYTGIIRPETAVYPGDLVEACYKAPNGPASWFTNWETGGEYPPAGSTPSFYGSSIFPVSPLHYIESDNPDGFAIQDGVTPAYDLTQGVTEVNQGQGADDRIQGSPFSQPGPMFLANSGVFKLNGNYSNFGQYTNTTFDRSAAKHCYQTEYVPATFQSPGSDTSAATVLKNGRVINSVDGVEYSDMVDNWNGGIAQSWSGNNLPGRPIASAIMVALQYGTLFRNNAYNAMTPTSVANDPAKLYTLRVWHRTAGTPPAPTLVNGITPLTGSTVSSYTAGGQGDSVTPIVYVPPVATSITPETNQADVTDGLTAYATTPMKPSMHPGNNPFEVDVRFSPVQSDITNGAFLLNNWYPDPQEEFLVQLTSTGYLGAYQVGGPQGPFAICNSNATTLTPGNFYTIRMVANPAAGTMHFYGSTDTSVDLGGCTGLATGTITANTSAIALGDDAAGATASHFAGAIESAALIINGVTVAAPVANDNATSGYSDSAGNVWAIQGTGSYVAGTPGANIFATTSVPASIGYGSNGGAGVATAVTGIPATKVGFYIGNGGSPHSENVWLGHNADFDHVFFGEASESDYQGSVGYVLGIQNYTDIGPDGVPGEKLFSVPDLYQGVTLSQAATGYMDADWKQQFDQMLEAIGPVLGNKNATTGVSANISTAQTNWYVRFGWEENACNQFKWASCGQSANFIAMFDRHVQIVRQELASWPTNTAINPNGYAAPNVHFVFCPTIGGSEFTVDYPGDAYVDVIGVDVYQNTAFGWSPDPDTAWSQVLNGTGFSEALSYYASFAQAHGKHLALPEWGVMLDNFEEYLKDMHAWVVTQNATSAPVDFLAYWDSNSSYPGMLSTGALPGDGAMYQHLYAPTQHPPEPLPYPTGLTIIPESGANLVTFNVSPTSVGATSWNLYAGNTHGGENTNTPVATTTSSANGVVSFTDTAANGQLRCYQVAAANSKTVGFLTPEGCGTPVAASTVALPTHYATFVTGGQVSTSGPNAQADQSTYPTPNGTAEFDVLLTPGTGFVAGYASGFSISLDANGFVDYFSRDSYGNTYAGVSPLPVPFPQGGTTPLWIKVLYNASYGSGADVALSYAPYAGTSLPAAGTFTALGTPAGGQNHNGVTANGDNFVVGNGFTGRIYDALLYLNGTLVADANFDARTSLTFTDSVGNSWVPTSGATFATASGTANTHSVTFGTGGSATTPVFAGAHVGNNPFSVDVTFTPTAADITSSNAYLAGIWGDPGYAEYYLHLANGTAHMTWTNGTTNPEAVANQSMSMVAGQQVRLHADVVPSTGQVNFYTYPNGVKTPLGTVITQTAGITPQTSSSGYPSIGATTSTSAADQLAGSVTEAILAVNGTTIFDAQANGTGFTDTQTHTWTLHGTALGDLSPAAPHAASTDPTLVTALNTPIYDGLGHTFQMVTGTVNGASTTQISINGVTDQTTGGVTELYWHASVVDQLNTYGNWYIEPAAGGPGAELSGSPIVNAGSSGSNGSPVYVNPTEVFSVGANCECLGNAPQVVPGTANTNYPLPTVPEVQYFAGKGFKVWRLSVTWERLQTPLGSALNPTYLGYMDNAISQAGAAGMRVIIDVHNYARYTTTSSGVTNTIGDGTLNQSSLVDLWTKLATHYANNGYVYAYDIMNEPHDMPNATAWPNAAQAVINGIRAVDTKTLLLIEGNGYSSAYNWVANGNDGLKNLTDPNNNFWLSAHFYMDRDSSGSHGVWSQEEAAGDTLSGNALTTQIGVVRATPFVNWANANGFGARIQIGELGIGNNNGTGVTDGGWNAAGTNVLTYLQAHNVPVTLWDAGPFSTSDIYTLEPTSNYTVDENNMAAVTPFSNPTSGVHAASANGTIVTTTGVPMYDGAGHTFTLVAASSGVSNYQIAINGTTDASTGAVTELYLNNATTPPTVDQLNTYGNWYNEPPGGGPGTELAGSPIPAVPAAPGAVTGLTLGAASGSLTASWTPVNATPAVSSYTLTANGVTHTGITGTSYSITGLTNGTAYPVTVQALNSYGGGSAGPVATATGTPNVPAQLNYDKPTAFYSDFTETSGLIIPNTSSFPNGPGKFNNRLAWGSAASAQGSTTDFSADYLQGSNNEQQCYVDAGVQQVSTGLLLQAVKGEANPAGQPWGSGVVISSSAMRSTYGYVEVVAKYPQTTNGLFTAIWTLGTNGGAWEWESDIAETGHDSTYAHGAAIQWGQSGYNSSDSPLQVVGSTASTQFHKYGMRWDPNKIEYFFDDQPYGTSPILPSMPLMAQYPGYVIINNALADIATGYTGTVDNTTTNPTNFYIRSVGIWKLSDWDSANLLIPRTPPAGPNVPVYN